MHSTTQPAAPHPLLARPNRVLVAAALGAVLLAASGLAGCASRPTTVALSGVALAGDADAQAALPAGDTHIHSGKVHVIAETPTSASGASVCTVCNVFEVRRDAVIRVRTEGGLGTGVVIDDNGSVLTNAHVVGDAKVVAIETYHGTVVRGTVERVSKEVDLAIVRVSAPDVKWGGISPAPQREPEPVVGSTVYVIGHPAGLGWTLTEGIISAKRRMGEVQPGELLQITAAVSPGNSGGPAFSRDGQWIGTVVSKFVGPGLENISFVIPASELRRFLAAK